MVEFFLWDMELYFDAAHIPPKEQVSTCALILLAMLRCDRGPRLHQLLERVIVVL